MTNHTIDSCFKKHGYPSHWKQDDAINQYASMPDRSEEQSVEFSEANAQDSHALAFTPD